MRLLKFAFLLGLLWAVQVAPAQAGAGCSEKALELTQIRNAFTMAARTRAYVEQSGASLVLVARVGTDLSEHGLRYSHLGALLRDHPAGPWVFVHLLNDCGTGNSAIYDEGLVNFYLDDPLVYEGVVLIPTPALQTRLASLFAGPAATAWHNPAYSMIARPTATKYQNSNQWLLELIAVAQAPDGSLTSREQAQRYFVQQGYRADTIRISDLRRFGAGIARANVRFDDHSAEESSNRRYEVASVRSVARYLEHTRALIDRAVITLDRPPQPPRDY